MNWVNDNGFSFYTSSKINRQYFRSFQCVTLSMSTPNEMDGYRIIRQNPSIYANRMYLFIVTVNFIFHLYLWFFHKSLALIIEQVWRKRMKEMLTTVQVLHCSSRVQRISTFNNKSPLNWTIQWNANGNRSFSWCNDSFFRLKHNFWFYSWM